MPIGSGLSGQFGFVAEVAYGTAVTVTRFLEVEPGESLRADIGFIENHSIGRGRMLRSTRRKNYEKGAMGSITLPVMTKGMNLLFEHMLGAHEAAVQGATSEYLHTSTVDLTGGKAGLSLTVQKGVPSVDGTVRAFTYAGVKIVGWTLACDLDGKLLLTLELDGKSEVTNVALASASFASGDEWFIFTEGTVELGGSAVSIRSFSISGTEALDTDRRFLGGGKSEPIANGEQVITVTLDPEFEDLDTHAAWKAGTVLTNLVLTFDTGDAIPSGDGGNFSLVLTTPALVLTNGGPVLGSHEIVRQPFEAKVLYDGTNNPFKIENTTTDTAA